MTTRGEKSAQGKREAGHKRAQAAQRGYERQVGKREAARRARVALVREAESMLGCTMHEWRRLMIARQIPQRLTVAEACTILRDLGLVLRGDPDADEWRVNYRGGAEATAYYTNDLADAVATGNLMALQRRS
jgi:hypothetical protein